uniref:NADP-dependent oxidoreductase domain-containing protein n=1 Tax=Phaeomonas parva TaxID=124430 RepID=A0A7S1XMA9_9STRA|mmetsp:Transcript_16108/g.49234  ORF Transcript_16108/g.49234 Transcript_16108/m.49234 type:complete len:481 (+) Transcript_16108:77-1519(+)|eukprot:CAMPEP_0118881176 /NCGR_PEP_ID=MMETSP1163-20130328/20659_1 /TAXON_ID=124430 /ORGANISM="Phaeomonas parva, Strain CCMP2877" /LENGTH=480 /DNA_ID=CAMNT_0006817855 /DNA_START=335 /DNA_END=1777 /DNA_ORIENTATION=-
MHSLGLLLVGAAALAGRAAGSASTPPMQLTLENRLGEEVELYWLDMMVVFDPGFTPKKNGVAPGGGSFTVTVYSGHVFVVAASGVDDVMEIGPDVTSFAIMGDGYVAAWDPGDRKLTVAIDRDDAGDLRAAYSVSEEHGLSEPVCTPAHSGVRLGDSSVVVPRVGFGCAALGAAAPQSVQTALSAGLRLLDSAQAREWYDERGVGEGLSLGVLTGAVGSRDEVFVTTKIHPRDFGYDSAMAAIDGSLRDLKVDHLDLVLTHFPKCMPHICGAKKTTWKEFLDTFRAMNDAQRAGKVRAVGVSNVQEHHLRRLEGACLDAPGSASGRTDSGCRMPDVVQNWFDPFNTDDTVRRHCAKHGIAYQGYSILGTQYLHRPGNDGTNPVLQHPIILKLARRKGVSPAVIVLRWALAKGVLALCRSTKAEHVEECAEIYRSLSEGAAAVITPGAEAALDDESGACTAWTFTREELMEMDSLTDYIVN